ncbi:MAG: Rpn family recombination-promoting nuclease/putative transposase [Alphaproteobacteria bacterium]|nr:Rpn family recombination-promoting nuclease/putative transposase [Alphaproteobacteria bacterium]
MRHRINPLVDYAFKRLLGTEANKNLTLHFLNAILRPRPPIVEIALVNPFNDRDYADDKLSVVDVKARDALGRVFQIELQVRLHEGVRPRMVYTWADLYQAQLPKGQDYETLQPVYAIWLLGEVLLPESPAVHHRFTAFDPDNRVALCDHFNLHTLELPKWRPLDVPLDDEQRWCTFFREAWRWTELPDALDTPEMRQAMGTLIEISDQERAYHDYASRLDQLRVKATIEASARRAQEALAATQAELVDTSAKLQDTQAELVDTTSRLDDTTSRLDDTTSRLEDTTSRLEDTTSRLEDTTSRLEDTTSRLEDTEARLAAERAERVATEARLQHIRQALLDAGLDPDALLRDEPTSP